MGGPSAEREVSIESGQAVMRALATLGHEAQSLDFDGRFVDALREIRPDVVFNALTRYRRRRRDDSRRPRVARIPYTGSDLTSCAIAMDKHLTKKLLAAEGLPTPAWDTFDLSGGTLPAAAGFAEFTARREAARQRFECRRVDRAHARGVDESDDRPVAAHHPNRG